MTWCSRWLTFTCSSAGAPFKVASTLSLAATATAMLFLAKAPSGSIGLLDALASAVTLGLFWQQAGWLAHDFCHQQVFADRALNNSAAREEEEHQREKKQEGTGKEDAVAGFARRRRAQAGSRWRSVPPFRLPWSTCCWSP